MTIIENVELLRSIFASPLVVPKLSRLKLFSITKHYGMNHLYIGNRINHAVDFPIMDEEESKEPSGRTLFFHDIGDSHYYDVLNDNTRCVRQKNGFTVANHVCTDIENLRDCLKPKVKKIGGRKWKI